MATLAVEPTDMVGVRVFTFSSSCPDSSDIPESQRSLHQFKQSMFIVIYHDSSVGICCDGRSPCLLCIYSLEILEASGVPSDLLTMQTRSSLPPLPLASTLPLNFRLDRLFLPSSQDQKALNLLSVFLLLTRVQDLARTELSQSTAR